LSWKPKEKSQENGGAGELVPVGCAVAFQLAAPAQRAVGHRLAEAADLRHRTRPSQTPASLSLVIAVQTTPRYSAMAHRGNITPFNAPNPSKVFCYCRLQIQWVA